MSENLFDFEMFDSDKFKKEPNKNHEPPIDLESGTAVKFMSAVITLCVLSALLPFLAHLMWIIGQWSWGLLY